MFSRKKNQLESEIAELKKVILSKNQEIELLNAECKLKSNLIAWFIHEVKTPLEVATIGTSTVLKQLSFLNEDQKIIDQKKDNFKYSINRAFESFKIVTSSIKNAINILHSFRLLSEPTSDQLLDDVNLKSFIEAIINKFFISDEEKAIRTVIDCDKNIIIKTNSSALSLIIITLIDNSLKHRFHVEHNGIITISIKKSMNNIVLIYSDNGQGIRMENRKNIFNPYFSTSSSGNGLGLYVIKSIIENTLKGTILLNEEKQIGTEFIITFSSF